MNENGEIDRLGEAMAAIRAAGYLNEFLKPGETWFVAHCVPGGESEDATPIAASTGFELIRSGKLERLGDYDLPAAGATRVIWYGPKRRAAGP